MSLEPLSYLLPSSLSLTTLSEYVPPLKKRRIDSAHDPIPDTAFLVAVTQVRGRRHFHYLVCISFLPVFVFLLYLMYVLFHYIFSSHVVSLLLL